MAKEFIKSERKRIIQDLDIQGRVQPQAIDFEEAVLGAMMLEQNATGQVIDKLSANMFYKEAHKFIFEAIYQVFESGDPVDLLSVTKQLRKNRKLEIIGGAYYLSTLSTKVVSSANIEFHARIISEKYIQRQLISVSTETIHDAFDETTDVLELLDKAEKNLFDIAEQNFRRSNVSMSELLQDFLSEMKEIQNNKNELRGLPSGFTELDRVTGGWQKSNLIILAARPGMGKTAFVLSMARNISIDQKKALAFFSLEMSAADLIMRLVSMETGFDQAKLKRADLDTLEWTALYEKITNLTDAPLIIDDTPALSIFELRAKCRRFKQQYNIECVVIDYLQLMVGGNENRGNREQEISSISRALKTLSKELNIPVIALSQLNRSVESRSSNSKRPQLSDLRESGAIEQDADMVIFIYRPEYYKLNFEDDTPATGLADLIIAKHRNGSLKDVRLRFIAEQTKFCDYIYEYLPLNPLHDSSDSTSVTIASRINNIGTNEVFDEDPFNI
ncbi:MAG: replicative DNA helicase [Bacteroidales bacterium]|jgi:replicative DNA helicase|nr:replicative DNA helicase [Bacteroidales bacterium]